MEWSNSSVEQQTLQSLLPPRSLPLDHPLWEFVEEGVDLEDLPLDGVIDNLLELGWHADQLDHVLRLEGT